MKIMVQSCILTLKFYQYVAGVLSSVYFLCYRQSTRFGERDLECATARLREDGIYPGGSLCL